MVSINKLLVERGKHKEISDEPPDSNMKNHVRWYIDSTNCQTDKILTIVKNIKRRSYSNNDVNTLITCMHFVIVEIITMFVFTRIICSAIFDENFTHVVEKNNDDTTFEDQESFDECIYIYDKTCDHCDKVHRYMKFYHVELIDGVKKRPSMIIQNLFKLYLRCDDVLATLLTLSEVIHHNQISNLSYACEYIIGICHELFFRANMRKFYRYVKDCDLRISTYDNICADFCNDTEKMFDKIIHSANALNRINDEPPRKNGLTIMMNFIKHITFNRIATKKVKEMCGIREMCPDFKAINDEFIKNVDYTSHDNTMEFVPSSIVSCRYLEHIKNSDSFVSDFTYLSNIAKEIKKAKDRKTIPQMKIIFKSGVLNKIRKIIKKTACIDISDVKIIELD
ncbi:MAG: hypothetical protein KDH96_12415, partial [Candidatus Riesia sp.]|nr:hypothetical protein [Candidatus Riesia sp.]